MSHGLFGELNWLWKSYLIRFFPPWSKVSQRCRIYPRRNLLEKPVISSEPVGANRCKQTCDSWDFMPVMEPVPKVISVEPSPFSLVTSTWKHTQHSSTPALQHQVTGPFFPASDALEESLGLYFLCLAHLRWKIHVKCIHFQQSASTSVNSVKTPARAKNTLSLTYTISISSKCSREPKNRH